jgi:DNA topoisomerase-1
MIYVNLHRFLKKNSYSMGKNLVIVESPAKAKTIKKFLGKDFEVKSSYGHIRDLPKKKMSIDLEHGFEPIYEVSADKKKLVAELKKASKEADMVWLASDEDREGEAIAWHLKETLKLTDKNTKRIVFHEITKDAILKAIETPRNLNMNLTYAQQARRILDRIVGYELSPLLWKKILPNLSAGRVQSVTVRLIIEREEEIERFTAESSFKVMAVFSVQQDNNTFELPAELSSRLPNEQAVEDFLATLPAASFTIESIETKLAKRTPAPPFTTSTLQQEASRKLGLPVRRTMQLAQSLYEAGHITYMRTDSVHLSNLAINTAKQIINETYGEKYSKVRQYKTKSKGAQEAHEAIRPTFFKNTKVSDNATENKLYELIWKRALASQMNDAEIERTTIKITTANNKKYYFVAKGEVIKFDGFLKVYTESKDDDQTDTGTDPVLPKIDKTAQLSLQNISAEQRFTQHPPRYTEASLVRKLEELGIGRPSTYAPTISTIQDRGYVVKEDREGSQRPVVIYQWHDNTVKKTTKKENYGAEKAKLFPTDRGIVVNKFLLQYFPDIVDYNFTAKVEKEFDLIAEGKTVWNKMIADFYKPFHEKIVDTEKYAQRETGERLLGTDPKTGKPVSVRIGKYGPFVQIGDKDDDEKPRFASLPKKYQIATITFEEAMELFKLPYTVGEYEDKPVTVAVGRFGPYLKHDNKFYSLKKDMDLYSIKLEEAIVIINEKREAEKNKVVKTFPEDDSLSVLRGRYGIYIKKGKQNYKIPKEFKDKDLSYEDCLAIMDDPKNLPKGRKSSRKK